MKCPKCQRRLAAIAETCLCGWKRGDEVAPRHARCAWDGCSTVATIRDEIEPGKGHHNICEYHYVEAHKLRAKRWCEAKGLHTVEQKKDYCRKLAGMVLKPMPQTKREPGQDDEERAE